MEVINVPCTFPFDFQSNKRKSNPGLLDAQKNVEVLTSQSKKKKKKKAKAVKNKPQLVNSTQDLAWQEILTTYRNPFTMLMPENERFAGFNTNSNEEAPAATTVEGEIDAVTVLPADLVEVIAEAPSSSSLVEVLKSVMPRYYKQRYDYFSLYDEGIQLDEEGWFSVTPELIAEHIALQSLELLQVAYPDRSASSFTVLDSFCGAGGNTIQFARHFGHVIAVDNNEDRLKMAKHNAGIYEVDSYMSFLVGDFWDMTHSFATNASPAVIDLLYLSPPWGGPNYTWLPVFSLITDIFSGRGGDMIKAALAVAKHVVLYLPRQTNIYEIALVLEEHGDASLRFTVEQHRLRGKFKAITVYIHPSRTAP